MTKTTSTSKTIASGADFDRALASFVRTSKTNMGQALRLSQYAIQHFDKCGDLGPAQRFYDAMIKNYHRKAAFKVWIMKYAPVIEDETTKKFVKDKSADAVAINIEGALAVPFWEDTPERPEVYFYTTDVYDALVRTLKRFEGEHVHARNERAATYVSDLKAQLEQFNTAFVATPAAADGTPSIQ